MFLPSISYLNISLPHKIKKKTEKKIASLRQLDRQIPDLSEDGVSAFSLEQHTNF